VNGSFGGSVFENGYVRFTGQDTRGDASGGLRTYLPDARRWNLARLKEALVAGVSPIVVDRGNGLNAETREFAAMAVEHGYIVELAEPDSSWWQELRVLLKYKEFVDGKLFDAWAQKLAQSTRDGHRVPASTIRSWLQNWRHDLTVDQILHCGDT
jgi:hypothetical protein